MLSCVYSLHHNCINQIIMVAEIIRITTEYEERLRNMPYEPRFSYELPMLRDDSAPNKSYLYYLFIERAMAIDFLKPVGLLSSKVLCNNCNRDMSWSVHSRRHDGFIWRCQRKVAEGRFNQSASIREEPWLQRSNLTLQEILLITYDTVYREPAHKIRSEYNLANDIAADWGMFCREVILVFLEVSCL